MIVGVCLIGRYIETYHKTHAAIMIASCSSRGSIADVFDVRWMWAVRVVSLAFDDVINEEQMLIPKYGTLQFPIQPNFRPFLIQNHPQ